MTGRRFVIGVDVGGTFTDVFALDRTSGRIATAKTPTTPSDQSLGFLAGIRRLVPDLGSIATIVHGTTTGTNALLERKGARAGLVTTKGFRDVLEMRRRDRPRTWGLRGGFVPPIPRDLRLEVGERVLADGTVAEPLDEDGLRRALDRLIEAGAEALCLFFINGYASDANERRAAEIARAIWPNPHVTVATELLPEIREFERVSTAALNACLQPLVSEYLDRLDRALRAGGFGGELLIVQSNGGLMDVGTARRFPVRTALSGPAAGVIAAGAIARGAGLADIITCDMGGTSFDVSLISGGRPSFAPQTEIGFGMTVRMPMIEIATVGAGGGSIARLDASGLLHVGPESAGSRPGPVACGLGNDRPTVTDANLVLGRIDPARPMGGTPGGLDVAAARAAILDRIGRPLGLGAEEAAEAILRVANAKMAGAIRLVSIERGHDPGRFALLPFGGGGALHAGALLAEVGLGAALVPRFPGVTSALGCVVADLRLDRVRTVNRLVAEADAGGLGREMAETAAALAGQIAAGGSLFERIDTAFGLDMLYVGQTHTVAVPLVLPEGGLTGAAIGRAFDAAYEAAYGRLLRGIPARIMNRRVTVIGRRPQFDLTVFRPDPGLPAALCRTGERPVWTGGAWVPTPVYRRLDLAAGEVLDGPAILEQDDTTIFLDPGLRAEVDGLGNLLVRRRSG